MANDTSEHSLSEPAIVKVGADIWLDNCYFNLLTTSDTEAYTNIHTQTDTDTNIQYICIKISGNQTHANHKYIWF